MRAPEALPDGPRGTLHPAAGVRDPAAFAALAERYRRELRAHCYRMLASIDEAEDLVQETLLRAWRRRESFEGRSSFRAWLYRIATNACLDHLAKHPRRPQPYATPTAGPSPAAAPSAVPWLQPCPDRLLEPVAPAEAEPDALVIKRETVELAFLIAVQHLPPRQRAVLLLRDVLGWSAAETGDLLDLSVPAVKSALQRARGTLAQHLPTDRPGRDGAAATVDERAAVARYVDASEQGDMSALATLLREDVRHTMPPHPHWFEGREAVLEMWGQVLVGPERWGDWRLVETRANGQPALASYVRRADESDYRAVNLDVLRIEGGQVVEVTTFDPELLPAFGLELTLAS